ncbi:hypothetical protein J6590_037911 [Homalodisca vitripennis]|nr:hypothetical protein J6590_037911 [Homalodisca vitripennis]
MPRTASLTVAIVLGSDRALQLANASRRAWHSAAHSLRTTDDLISLNGNILNHIIPLYGGQSGINDNSTDAGDFRFRYSVDVPAPATCEKSHLSNPINKADQENLTFSCLKYADSDQGSILKASQNHDANSTRCASKSGDVFQLDNHVEVCPEYGYTKKNKHVR